MSDSVEMLVVRVHDRLAAIAVEDVVETFRPLPTEPLAGAPAFVRGVALVRGVPTPVVDLAALLEGHVGVVRGARFVTVRTGDRQVALEVNEVLDVRSLERDAFSAAPLLQGAASAAVDTLAALDGELLAVLDAARILASAPAIEAAQL